MTSFAFVMGVLPMARATGAGAYSRNSLGIVIAFGIAVSTVLGRFVIPIYYVLGERIIDAFGRLRSHDDEEETLTDSMPHPHLEAPSNGFAQTNRPGLQSVGLPAASRSHAD